MIRKINHLFQASPKALLSIDRGGRRSSSSSSLGILQLRLFFTPLLILTVALVTGAAVFAVERRFDFFLAALRKLRKMLAVMGAFIVGVTKKMKEALVRACNDRA